MGDKARMYKILRDGNEMKFSVELKKLDPPKEPMYIDHQKNPFCGAVVVQMCPALASDFGFDLSTKGVVILEIEPQTLAAQLRLKAGDIVVKVNRQTIKTVKDIEQCSIQRFGHIPKQMKIVVMRGEKK